MQADSQPLVDRSPADKSPKPKTARSRLSNGSALLPGLDGRSTWARRARDLVESHISDLGGDAGVSEGERAIVRRAAVLIVELERMEAAFALGEGAPDLLHLDAYQRAANSLRRLLESVGLQRRARDVTPTVADIAREYEAARAAGEVSASSGGDVASAVADRAGSRSFEFSSEPPP